MNKKGFTLIELLSTIAIMSLIATIATVNVVKIFDAKKEANQIEEQNIITTAACVYIELEKNKDLKATCLNIGCSINTDTLIKEGLLNKDEVDKPQIINIYKENNEKKCTINNGG